MAFHYFTSSDVGAPTLNGVNGTLISVLDWVFTTVSADWDKVFSGSNKAVYRAKTGNRMYLRVVHDSAISGSAARATVRAAEGASDVDTLIDAFPTVALKSDTVSTWNTSDTANSTARDYRGIITEKFLILLVNVGSSNLYGIYFFGEIQSKEASDTVYNTVIFVTSNAGASTFFNNPSRYASGQYDIFWARSFDGSVKSSVGGHFQVNGQSSFGLLPSSSGAKSYAASPTGKMHIAPIRLSCMGSQTSTAGASSLFERGYLPHFWQPLHQSSSINSLDTFIDSSYNPSVIFELYSASSSNVNPGSFLVLEKTNTWSSP